MVNLNEWKRDIVDHYNYLQSELRNIKQNDLYKSFQKEIEINSNLGNSDIANSLIEACENRFNLSDIYNQFNWMHSERIAWLKEYTNSNDVKDTEFYRNMAYKFIHEDVMVFGLQSIILYNSHRLKSLEKENAS